MSEKTVIEFDLDRYLRASKKLDLSGLDWDDIPNHPLTDGDVTWTRAWSGCAATVAMEG